MLFPSTMWCCSLTMGMFDGKLSDANGFYVNSVFAVDPDIDLPVTRTILHEVAHYYWHGSRLWIDEGMAELAVAAFGGELGSS